MNARIQSLRAATLAATPRISIERAQIVTHTAKTPEYARASVPMRRALVFKAIFETKQLHIGEGELIVGERGPAPAAVPTYPEICIHTAEDFEMLDSREKIPYRVDDQTRRIHLDEIRPFWEGLSQRERMFRELPRNGTMPTRPGVFTEFQEQRSPGHTVLGETIYQKGMLDLKLEIRAAINALDFALDPLAYDKREELRAMDLCADALIVYANRHADNSTNSPPRKATPSAPPNCANMAGICRKVPANAPEPSMRRCSTTGLSTSA
jgi:trans-4-hydroxy-L-proline dehydratase